MSEDKTQHDEQQELDFEEAKELTVGEAVRKDAELKAGVTDSDSILDKYIKQHRDEVASQKFVNQVEADGDTSPLDDFIRKQRQELADSGLIDESLVPEAPSASSETEASQEAPLAESVTPVTFGIGQTPAVEASPIEETPVQQGPLSEPTPVQTPAEPVVSQVVELSNQEAADTAETVITSTNAENFITSEVEQLDLGQTQVAPTPPEEPSYFKGPLVEGVDMDQTIDLSQAVAGVTGASLSEVEETPVFSNADTAIEEADEPEELIAHASVAGEYDPDREDVPVYRRKGVVIGALTVLALAIAGGGYAFYQGTRNTSTTTSSTASSSSSSTDTAASDNQAFEDMYNNFFTDDAQTQLANDQFEKLPDLEKLLNNLENTQYYDAAKSKYDALKKQIEAVQKVNEQYESDAIVDGSYNSSISVKSNANFNDLSDDVTTTGNATLDSTIQEAIQGGKTQLEEKANAASAASAATASASASVANNATAPAPANGNTGSAGSGAAASTGGGAASNTGGSSVLVSRGITNYNPSILQRDRSRVPYNASAVADTGNSAWIWGDGVLDRIIATSHSRGYFSGDNFILEPVNIINGNGYYNLYLPDGTYLFSINCKTGYFVGNGSGHSDNLDY